MKNFNFILLSLLLSCGNSKNDDLQKTKIQKVDTIHPYNISTDSLIIVNLTGKIFLNDKIKILHINYIDKSLEKIEIFKNNKLISSIILPKADEEIKNFSLNEINETKEGFNIFVSWGGGNDFYTRKFNFKYLDGKFYLNQYEKTKSIPEDIKNSKKEIVIIPNVNIDSLNLIIYLENN